MDLLTLAIALANAGGGGGGDYEKNKALLESIGGYIDDDGVFWLTYEVTDSAANGNG